MSSAQKLIMFAVLLTLITVVSGECEEKCHCTKYKVFCSLARLGALPTRISNTTELVKIELDDIHRINNTTTGLQNITHLQLLKVQLQEIEPGAFRNMSLLEHLAITHNSIALLKPESFKYLDKLYSLNLSSNSIWSLSWGTFSGLLNLRILDLSYNNIMNLQTYAFEGMSFNEINAVEYEYLFYHSRIAPAVFKYLSTLTYFQISDFNSKFLSVPPKLTQKHVLFGLRISYKGYTEYVSRNNKFLISELSYLDMSSNNMRNLMEIKFRNFTKLAYLDLSDNRNFKISSGYFQGLVSLKILKINNNDIGHLNNGAFYGLHSLEILDVSHCNISTIEDRAFEGLAKLRTLDLSWNQIHILKNSTFAMLRMLKELILEVNAITQIDYGSFCDLTNLKRLSNSPSDFYQLTGRRSIEHLKPLNVVNETAFSKFQRLDSLQLFLPITIPKEIQIVNILDLYIHAGYDNPQKQLLDALQTVHYVRTLNVTVLQVKSTQFLPTLYQFRISDLAMSLTDLVFLNSKNLCCLSTLKYLSLFDILSSTIEEGAFHAMKGLKGLFLHYKYSFRITRGLLLGLENLTTLYINCQIMSECQTITSDKSQKYIKYLQRDVFLGMDNLRQLVLSGNYYRGLKPGAFHGLTKIEEIDLRRNEIEEIQAGVFGAICKDGFEISCKNVTLSEYCNNSNGLKTLKYLYLSRNNISHIHPHAFVSCTNLQILDLSFNRFLTLDNLFLFTPGLRKLVMSWCNITNIPNETFACTPLLSKIEFEGNRGISKLRLTALLPLRHLQNINLESSNLSYDCDTYDTWIWMRQHRVNYEISFGNKEKQRYHPHLKDVEAELSNMICTSTVTNTSFPKNRTTDTDDFAFFKQYIEPILLIIILTFGLVSNGFLLFITLRHSDMRTKQNACIIHLSTVELLSLVLNLPLSYWDVVNIRWEFDDTLCKIFIFSKDVGVAATAFSTVALGVERFLVARTFGNLKKMCKSEKQPTAWLLLMTWISGIVCSLPAYFSAGVFEGRCLYCPPGNQSYIRNVWTFQLIMYCLLPALAITFLNVKTCLFLRESIRKIPGEIKDNDRIKNRRKVANVALILVLVIVIGYLPNYILRFLVAWSLVDMEDLFLPSFFTFCLFFSNAIFNPISIFIMSSKFKFHALKYFPFLEKFQHSLPAPVGLNRNLRRHAESRGNIPLRDFGKQYTPGNDNRDI